jgi:uncharacterized protein with PIN domain
MKLKRKIKRQSQQESKKDIKKKVGLFRKIPDFCLTCNKKFDKTDKEMVTTWNVVVDRQKEKVRLYCPECWTKAQDLIKEITNGQENTESDV